MAQNQEAYDLINVQSFNTHRVNIYVYAGVNITYGDDYVYIIYPTCTGADPGFRRGVQGNI